MNVLEDASLVIRKEKAEESKKSEQSGQLYNVLLGYVQKLKLQSAVERNLLQAKTLGKKILQAGESVLFGAAASSGSHHHKLKSDLRPQNVVRFYEKALKAQKSILNLEKDALDPFKALEYEFSERLCQTQIRFFIGLHYANEKQYAEALLVLQKVAQDVESVIEFAQKSNLGSQRNIKREIVETLEEGTLTRLPGLICKCHAKLLLSEHEEKSKVKEEMMQIDTGSGNTTNKKEAKFDNLYELLFNGAGQTKSQASLTKKVVISGERLDFLDQANSGSNVAFVESFGGKKVVEIDKIKISK